MKTYLVGGAVRDKIMGKEPKDRDWVIVGASKEDVANMLAAGYEQVGADFPVFLHPVTREEYALARTERKTGVGYLGFTVETENVTIEDDLARRDLTMNSMAMDETGKIIDPFNGQRDIRNHVLRHTTEAFMEDPLRVLRLARFAARYGFSVADETVAMCRVIGPELNHLSIERIWTELAKGFSEEDPLTMFEVMNETQALGHCHILQRTFGSKLNDWQRAKLRVVPTLTKDAETRFIVGVVAAASRYGLNQPPYSDEIAEQLGRKERGDALQGAPTRMLTLYQNMHTLLRAERSAPGLMQVLKKSGALREGPAFMDLKLIAIVLEMSGSDERDLPFTATELEIGAQQMRSIRAAECGGFVGAALGAEIDRRRLVALQMAMSIPNGGGTQAQMS